jgi:hypothetical protein
MARMRPREGFIFIERAHARENIAIQRIQDFARELVIGLVGIRRLVFEVALDQGGNDLSDLISERAIRIRGPYWRRQFVDYFLYAAVIGCPSRTEFWPAGPWQEDRIVKIRAAGSY